jgi:hypothetical protein
MRRLCVLDPRRVARCAIRFETSPISRGTERSAQFRKMRRGRPTLGFLRKAHRKACFPRILGPTLLPPARCSLGESDPTGFSRSRPLSLSDSASCHATLSDRICHLEISKEMTPFINGTIRPFPATDGLETISMCILEPIGEIEPVGGNGKVGDRCARLLSACRLATLA